MHRIAQGAQTRNQAGAVGSYAISTVNFDSLMSETVVQTPARLKKTKNTKTVVHKIFADCSSVIEDTFWIEKFEASSMGRLPRWFFYSEGSLVFKKSNKKQTLNIPDDPYEAAQVCMEFFRSHGGIFSPIDKQNTNDYQRAQSQEMANKPSLTWATANKKMQHCLLNHYIIDMKDVMQLSQKEGEILRQIVLLGIANKYFSKTSVTVLNNRIQTIDGLLWDDQKRTFYINPELKPAVSRSNNRNKDTSGSAEPNSKDTVPTFQAKWKKYGEYLSLQLVCYQKRQRQFSVIGSAPTLVFMNSDSQSLTGMSTDITDITDITDTTDQSEDYDTSAETTD